MSRSKHTEAQMIGAIKQLEAYMAPPFVQEHFFVALQERDAYIYPACC